MEKEQAKAMTIELGEVLLARGATVGDAIAGLSIAMGTVIGTHVGNDAKEIHALAGMAGRLIVESAIRTVQRRTVGPGQEEAPDAQG